MRSSRYNCSACSTMQVPASRGCRNVFRSYVQGPAGADATCKADEPRSSAAAGNRSAHALDPSMYGQDFRTWLRASTAQLQIFP